MRFAIFGNTYQTRKTVYTENLINLLNSRNADILIYREFYDFLVSQRGMDLSSFETFADDGFSADLVISLGGDGTFLKAASMVGKKNIPILGINTGRLGFLADISPDEMDVVLDEIFSNRYSIEKRSVLQLECGKKSFLSSPYALNDIAVLKRDSSSMITIHTSINGAYLTTYQADGLIVATPTGSTAYSLSVGGPIMVPSSDAMVLTAVAPHSLNVRPIVIPDNWEITLDVESRSKQFLVAIDGRSETCEDSSKLTIRRADYSIKVLKRFDYAYFSTLRSKMKWGIDSRN